MEFSRQEYWNGLPFPIPEDLPNPGIKPMSLESLALASISFATAPPGKSKAASWAPYAPCFDFLPGASLAYHNSTLLSHSLFLTSSLHAHIHSSSTSLLAEQACLLAEATGPPAARTFPYLDPSWSPGPLWCWRSPLIISSTQICPVFHQ